MSKYNLGQWVGQPLRVYKINSGNQVTRDSFRRAAELAKMKQELLAYYSSLPHFLEPTRLLNRKEAQKRYNKTICVISAQISLIQNMERLDPPVAMKKLVHGCEQLNKLYQGNFNLNLWLELTIGVSIKDGKIVRVIPTLSNQPDQVPDELRIYSSGSTIRPGVNLIRVSLGTPIEINKIVKSGLDLMLDQQRFDQLMKICDEDADQMVAMLYRYHFMIWESGMFLSVMPSLWPFIKQYVKDNMPVDTTLMEGFACPLNNNLPKYCSIFEEDRAFGSLGDFFSYQPNNNPSIKNERTFMVINPPFVETILTKTSQRVADWLSHCKRFTALLIWPYWLDDAGPGYWNEEGLSSILSLPKDVLRWHIKLERGQYDIFNTSTGEAFVSTFQTILILLSNDPVVTLPASSIQNLISPKEITRSSSVGVQSSPKSVTTETIPKIVPSCWNQPVQTRSVQPSVNTIMPPPDNSCILKQSISLPVILPDNDNKQSIVKTKRRVIQGIDVSKLELTNLVFSENKIPQLLPVNLTSK